MMYHYLFACCVARTFIAFLTAKYVTITEQGFNMNGFGDFGAFLNQMPFGVTWWYILWYLAELEKCFNCGY